MPPKKKLTDEEKKLEQYRKAVINAMIKLKEPNSRFLLYDRGIRAKTMNMNNSEFKDFKQDLEISFSQGETPVDAAQKLITQALHLRIIEPHITQSLRIKEQEKKDVKEQEKKDVVTTEEDLKREYKEDQEKPGALQMSFRDFLLTQGTRVPLGLLARDPLFAGKSETKKETKEEGDVKEQTKTPTSLLADTSPTKAALSQRKVRTRAKERAIDEQEKIIKQTEERVRKEVQEIADRKIAVMMKELEELKKGESKKLSAEKKGTLPRGVETILDVAPSVARMAGMILAPKGMGPSVGKLAQSLTTSGASALGNLLRSEPEQQGIKEKEEKEEKEEPTILEIGTGGYTPQAIPAGLKKFMTNIGVYTSIYSRLSPEQKTMLGDVDQGMLVLKQALTRRPVTSASSKTYHSAVGKVLNKMNREMDNPEDIKNNIQELAKTLEDAPEEIKNVITPIDNALRVGYGQVVEMKRSGNILQPLVETARNEILKLEPQEIMEAFNSVMRNATEVELGGQMRVEPRERKIPQFGLEQARQIQQIVRSTSEEKETPLPKTEQKRGLEFTPEMPEFIRSGILNPPTLLAGSQQPMITNLPTVDAKGLPLTTPSIRTSFVVPFGDSSDTKSLFRPGGMQPTRSLSTAETDRKTKSNMEIADIEGRIKEEMAKEVEKQLQKKRDLKADIEAEDEEGRQRVRKVGQKALEGVTTVAGIGAVKLLPDVIKNIYSNIMETPITMPETQAQSDQKISSATGTMRPRFIVPSRDSVIPSMPKIRADDIQFSAFDYVPPGTEGGNGTARTNPLVLSQELEERLRYSNAGITVSPGMGENVINMILTESELKALLLPRGPEVSPVIYEFPIIDGDQAQNEVKRYDQNLIQVEKFSPYNEYNENYQLDEEVFGSILLSYVP